jgi:hypothetical protein
VIPAEMLPVLRLRREAAARGWRRTPFQRPPQGDDAEPVRVIRTLRFERQETADHEAGTVLVRRPARPGPPDFESAKVTADTPEGLLILEHFGPADAVRILRAYARWPYGGQA